MEVTTTYTVSATNARCNLVFPGLPHDAAMARYESERAKADRADAVRTRVEIRRDDTGAVVAVYQGAAT